MPSTGSFVPVHWRPGLWVHVGEAVTGAGRRCQFLADTSSYSYDIFLCRSVFFPGKTVASSTKKGVFKTGDSSYLVNRNAVRNM